MTALLADFENGVISRVLYRLLYLWLRSIQLLTAFTEAGAEKRPIREAREVQVQIPVNLAQGRTVEYRGRAVEVRERCKNIPIS